ncbi:MAG: hypothetical protein H0U54_04095 [Acidobacteria bacterium]|nr:hypothetical protein [Acidobacteriota bacterium]
MKKQGFSSCSNLQWGVLIVGLMSVLLASCSSSAPVTNSSNVMAITHSTPEQKKNSTPAAGTSNSEPLKARLTELFALCKSDDLDTAAAYFVYRGPDKSREWKDILHAEDPTEKGAVVSLCRRIKGYLDRSEGYEFGAVKVEKESEGEWHGLEVSFRQGDKVKKALFGFLLINGQFAIGDID